MVSIAPLAAIALLNTGSYEDCSLSAPDQAWVNRALDAWHLSVREISGIGKIPNFRVVFFDDKCALTSDNALTTADAKKVRWNTAAHTGEVLLPTGDKQPVGVTSYTSGTKDYSYFVMSVPSIWRKGGLDRGGKVDLESTMVAVMLHEASHVAQTGPYGRRLGRLIDENKLPDDFSDDTLQKTFRVNKAFAASVQRETDLFLKAASAQSDAEARQLAREAREVMRSRQKRWLVGKDAYFVEAENIWLTFEGAGQWVGYKWLTHPKGGGFTAEDALPGFKRGGGWWSQSQGFALILVLDRLVGPSWKRHAFGDGKYTALEMLDRALEL